jgi:type 1 glutamine amidotransferase
MRLFAVLGLLVLILSPLSSYAEETSVIYEGKDGPGKGKHIVFIASDHEYRGEESCPAIARILAYHHGFKCTVLFGLDAEGYIQAGSSRIPGLEVLKDADMMFCFLRFVAPNDESMQHIIDYLGRGGPVAGLRTTTHAFNGLKGKNSKYNYNSSDETYRHGFGRQILGETWRPPAAGHYGRNHVFSTRMNVVPSQAKHPVMSGVTDMHAMAGAYSADPLPNSVILATNEVLKTMKPDAEPVDNKPPQPAIWVRTYKSTSGKEGRVFATTQGASEDILSDGVRRCIINGVFWCMELEKHIKPDMDIAFVGPYHPTTFNFGGYRKKVKPADIAGWDTPIWNPKASTAK